MLHLVWEIQSCIFMYLPPKYPLQTGSLKLTVWKYQELDDGVSMKNVDSLMPRRVKKRRKIQSEDGSDQGWEEYFEYIFPEDEADKPNLKLLAMAKMWKKNQVCFPMIFQKGYKFCDFTLLYDVRIRGIHI